MLTEHKEVDVRTQVNVYLGRSTSESRTVPRTCGASSPSEFVIIKDDKRIYAVCNKNCLESVSLENNKKSEYAT